MHGPNVEGIETFTGCKVAGGFVSEMHRPILRALKLATVIKESLERQSAASPDVETIETWLALKSSAKPTSSASPDVEGIETRQVCLLDEPCLVRCIARR